MIRTLPLCFAGGLTYISAQGRAHCGLVSTLGLHVARIRSGLEAECANQVGGFVPLKRDKWISRGKQREALRAQMPGYIFVELDITDPVAWHKVAEGKGFSHFIPGQTTAAELDRIRETLDLEGVYIEPSTANPIVFEHGEALLIANGPFTGVKAKCLKHSGEKILLIAYLTRGETRLYMPSSCCIRDLEADTDSSAAAKPLRTLKRPRGGKSSRFYRKAKSSRQNQNQ